VRSAAGDTRVIIAPGALDALPALVAGYRVILVADRRVLGLHGQAVRSRLGDRLLATVPLPAGEAAKTPAVLAQGWSRFARLGVRRDDLVVALGGGAALDCAGFLAATFMRGIPWLALPTTLLAQADACIGGKTAVDLPEGKNLAGAFHPPIAALADPAFLTTLPEGDFRAARFELLKCGWIGDPRLTALAGSRRLDRREPGALAEAVTRALRTKARLVSRDFRDHGVRRLLNLGHTFGHALEAAGKYRELRHGDAVGIGLLAAAHAACALGLLDPARLAARRREVLALQPPPVRAALVAPARRLALGDKKRDREGLVLVLPTARGVVVRSRVETALFAGSLRVALAEVSAVR
jgi:3-dehydroquinate synthase